MTIPERYKRCFSLLCCLPEIHKDCPIKKECTEKAKEKCKERFGRAW